MEKNKSQNGGKNGKLFLEIWHYSFYVALALILGYLGLVGALIYPILRSADPATSAYIKAKKDSERKKALREELQTKLEKAADEKTKKELETRLNSAREAEETAKRDFDFVKNELVGDKEGFLKSREAALDAIKILTAVFGPWIASLVAFYFAGRQVEKVSDQLGQAQKLLTAAVKPDAKKILEGKLVNDIWEKYDPAKHNFPLLATQPLGDATSQAISTIRDCAKAEVKCFIVFTNEAKTEIEGILTQTDIKKILETPTAELAERATRTLGWYTTDWVRLITAKPTQTLAEIVHSLNIYDVLPVVSEEKKILGFVYRDNVYKLLSGIS